MPLIEPLKRLKICWITRSVARLLDHLLDRHIQQVVFHYMRRGLFESVVRHRRPPQDNWVCWTAQTIKRQNRLQLESSLESWITPNGFVAFDVGFLEKGFIFLHCL